MNLLAVKELREAVASKKMKFDMHECFVITECGSAGCIGGHAAWIWPEVRAKELTLTRPPNNAEVGDKSVKMQGYMWEENLLADRLGLDLTDTHYLCYPPLDFKQVKRADAVMVLDHLIETGKADWSILPNYDQIRDRDEDEDQS